MDDVEEVKLSVKVASSTVCEKKKVDLFEYLNATSYMCLFSSFVRDSCNSLWLNVYTPGYYRKDFAA